MRILCFLAATLLCLRTHGQSMPSAAVESFLLLLLFATTVALMAALHYGGASFLLGAFLAGLCFCTVRPMRDIWRVQVKRVSTWLVRMFFAASVGFQIPVRRFASARVVGRGAIYLVSLFGKLVTGLLTIPPLTLEKMLTVGLSMSAWGEFAFVIAAAASNDLKLISRDTHAACLLAVLVSTVVSPTALRLVLSYFRRRRRRQMQAAMFYPSAQIFYKLNVLCLSRWGLLVDLLRVLSEIGLDVKELRSEHIGHYVIFEAFLLDERLIDDSPEDPTVVDGLADRLSEIRSLLLELLSHDPDVIICEEDVVDHTRLRGVHIARWFIPASAQDAAPIEDRMEPSLPLPRAVWEELQRQLSADVDVAVQEAQEEERELQLRGQHDGQQAEQQSSTQSRLQYARHP